jgi:hypothetical protein
MATSMEVKLRNTAGTASIKTVRTPKKIEFNAATDGMIGHSKARTFGNYPVPRIAILDVAIVLLTLSRQSLIWLLCNTAKQW